MSLLLFKLNYLLVSHSLATKDVEFKDGGFTVSFYPVKGQSLPITLKVDKEGMTITSHASSVLTEATLLDTFNSVSAIRQVFEGDLEMLVQEEPHTIFTKVGFTELVGKTIKYISVDKGINFYTDDKEDYTLTHIQKGGEVVFLESVSDAVSALKGGTIRNVLVSYSDDEEVDMSPYRQLGQTWTHITIVTDNVTVVAHWYGTSDGNQDETPSLYKIG